MKILITGADGYMGWPLFLKLIYENPNFKIIGIDNFLRRRLVNKYSKKEFKKIYSMKERIKELKNFKKKNFEFHNIDILDKKKTYNLIKKFKPDVIFHLASQPSAPFANKNLENSIFTSKNNNLGTLNLLWCLKELNLNKTLFVETTTTGTYGSPNLKIPEGEINYKNNKILFPGMGHSWYHITKSNDINYLWLANKLWGLPIVDFRTAITLGSRTKYTNLSDKFVTRFDYDFYFGVVVNRFIMKAIKKQFLPIYGKGEQKKPFIDLEDAVDSLYNVLKFKNKNKFHIFNQYSETLSIVQISNLIKKVAKKFKIEVNIKNVKNPRTENETHKMTMMNSKFLKILKRKPKSILKSIELTFQDLI